MVSVRGGGSEECPKLLSLKEETPLLALPDKVELLPSRPDCGLVGDAGIGWRGDCLEKNKNHVKIDEGGNTAACCTFQLWTAMWTTMWFRLYSKHQLLMVFMCPAFVMHFCITLFSPATFLFIFLPCAMFVQAVPEEHHWAGDGRHQSAVRSVLERDKDQKYRLVQPQLPWKSWGFRCSGAR